MPNKASPTHKASMQSDSVPDQDQLRKRAIELVNLPTLPSILKRISVMTRSTDTNASDIAELISTDQVLSAKILRLVNSPVYGFPGRISSVTHAVVLLGFNVVKAMVLGTSVFNELGKSGSGFWEHSLGTAVVARHLAKQALLDNADEVMMAGLLHDLGKVVLFCLYSGAYTELTERARLNGAYIGKLEKERFGIDHARINRWLSEEWHFPASLAEPLKYHHVPSLAKECPKATAIVHISDILARGLGYGYPGDMTLPPFDGKALDLLGLPAASICSAIEDAEAEFASGAAVLGFED